MDGPLPSIARSTHQRPAAPSSTQQHSAAPADLDAASCAISVANIEEHAPQGKAEGKLEETKVASGGIERDQERTLHRYTIGRRASWQT